jgi:uncharacterized protein (DUF488 family)
MASSQHAWLLTIGYEGRRAEGLVEELRSARILVVVDVRLTPLSRKPGLSKRRLADSLEQAGITYVHIPELGNPKENRASFRKGDPLSRTRFRALLRSQEAAAALERVAALTSDSRVALLCFERHASECHRHVISDEIERRVPALAVAHA